MGTSYITTGDLRDLLDAIRSAAIASQGGVASNQRSMVRIGDTAAPLFGMTSEDAIAASTRRQV
jgi:hypothetical protein